MARIPPPKGEWGIRLPHRGYYWHTGKPDPEGFHISNRMGAVRMPSYIQKENGRLYLHGETCHHFALFSYLHPGNKVKLGNVTPMAFCDIGSIMEIPVEPVFLALFHNHPLVAQECSDLHSLVVSQFYALPSIAIFQLFEQVVIAVDITALKCGV